MAFVLRHDTTDDPDISKKLGYEHCVSQETPTFSSVCKSSLVSVPNCIRVCMWAFFIRPQGVLVHTQCPNMLLLTHLHNWPTLQQHHHCTYYTTYDVSTFFKRVTHVFVRWTNLFPLYVLYPDPGVRYYADVVGI